MTTILVPLDGSEFAAGALPTAVALARASGGSLRLVRIVQHRGPVAKLSQLFPRREKQTSTAGEALERKRQKLRPADAHNVVAEQLLASKFDRQAKHRCKDAALRQRRQDRSKRRHPVKLRACPASKPLLDVQQVERKMRIRVYETDSVHKSMSCLRQGSIVAVKDEDYNHHVSAFREAVFIHASTSPNAQIIASMDVARRQMELEGYELVRKAIEIALAIRKSVNEHPIISKYFRVLGSDGMIPKEFRNSGFRDFLAEGANWMTALKAVADDEFFLDPTRMTLVCGTAGFDGSALKGLLASKYNIQLNKTSRNSVLLQSNINNTRSDVALLIKVLLEISQDIEARLAEGGDSERAALAAKVKSLMTDVPDLPNFSRFHDGYREDPKSVTLEGDMRSAFFAAYEEDDCEYLPLMSPKIDERLAKGPQMVSANFVIPYPPGFPIMVPGQVIEADTIGFMRKLDVKEIHGYNNARGLKLIKLSAIGKVREKAEPKKVQAAPASAAPNKKKSTA